KQRKAHGLEEFRSDCEHVCFNGRVLRLAFDVNSRSPQPVAQKGVRRVAHGNYARHGGKAGLQFTIESLDSLLFVTGYSRVNSEEQDVVCIESRTYFAQIGERP